MKKLIIILAGLTISPMNIVFGNDCIQKHDTHNVGHQFYEALIETPKDAIVKGAVATKELGKDVVEALSSSNAPHDLKNAAKELVIDAPVKTGQAIKNGTLKAVESTKNGAKAAYNVIIRKPAYKIKKVAEDVVNSDFVQGTKETFIELGEQFAEAGHGLVDATKYGAHKVYHVAIEKPVGAVKAAAHYFAHEHEEEHNHTCTNCDVCVMILPSPLRASQSLEFINNDSRATLTPNVTTIAVMPMSWVNGSVRIVTADNPPSVDEEIDLEFMVDVPCQLTEDRYSLSEKTLNQLAEAYQLVKDDLRSQR